MPSYNIKLVRSHGQKSVVITAATLAAAKAQAVADVIAGATVFDAEPSGIVALDEAEYTASVRGALDAAKY